MYDGWYFNRKMSNDILDEIKHMHFAYGDGWKLTCILTCNRNLYGNLTRVIKSRKQKLNSRKTRWPKDRRTHKCTK